MEVVFRKASREDVEGIIALCNECFDENTSLEYSYRVYDETSHDPNQIYLVGLADGNIISHVKLTIVPTMYEAMNTYAVVNHFCVKKEFRRHHIATKMLEYMTRICEERKCKTIKLWSNNVRVAAHACYHKNGFDKIEAGFFEKEIG